MPTKGNLGQDPNSQESARSTQSYISNLVVIPVEEGINPAQITLSDNPQFQDYVLITTPEGITYKATVGSLSGDISGALAIFARSTNGTIQQVAPSSYDPITREMYLQIDGTPQVQSNWGELGVNDPSYIRNKPTIPAAQVQSDWTQASSSAVDYIKNKPPAATQQQVLSADPLANKEAVTPSLMNFQQQGAGAVLYPLVSKMRQTVSVKDFGAVGDGIADDYDAFMAAINSVTYNPGGVYPSAGTIFVPPGVYYISQTINLKKQVNLVASGGATGYAQNTVLLFADGVIGIIINTYNTTYEFTETVPTGSASGSNITGLTITAKGKSNPNAHGILMRGSCNINYTQVSKFGGDGIRIYAWAGGGGALEGNANGWSLQNCRLFLNNGNGLYVQGADANAGSAMHIDVADNTIGGIYESSFLGNTYIACHAAANGRAYVTTSINARNVFVGCYAEGGQGESQLSYPTVYVGGIHASPMSGTVAVYSGEGVAQGWAIGVVGGNRGYNFAPRGGTPSVSNLSMGIHMYDNAVWSVSCDLVSSIAFQQFYGLWGLRLSNYYTSMLVTTNAAVGIVTKINITSGGAGYTSAAVEITGNGSGATATATITQGVITAITIVTAGAGYTSADVNITGNGSGATATAICSAKVSAGRSASPPPGSVFFESGVWIGGTTSGRNIKTGGAIPTTEDCAQGDIIFNSSPVPGGFVGWVCTTAGTPGTWKAFGAITA